MLSSLKSSGLCGKLLKSGATVRHIPRDGKLDEEHLLREVRTHTGKETFLAFTK